MPNHKNLAKKWNKDMRRLLEKDCHTCWLCKERVRLDLGKDNPFSPTIDHVLEKRNAGWDSYDNYRLAHKFCNGVRSQYPEPKSHPKYQKHYEEFRKLSKIEKRISEQN